MANRFLSPNASRRLPGGSLASPKLMKLRSPQIVSNRKPLQIERNNTNGNVEIEVVEEENSEDGSLNSKEKKR
jgi:hypothetical protein